ncbi:MAG TPA: DUF2784 domain-containing protein [Pyrinomonadaceae bacterium]|jgi:hypothetical protein
MWYGLLADLVVAIHIAYVAYIIVGMALILVGLKRKWNWTSNLWFRLSHLAAILIVILELIFKTTCPLTLLELKFRSLAGQPVTEATFVERLMYYILSGWLPGSFTNSIYVVVALVIAVTFVISPPRWRQGKQSS